jgi:hypothetical protein
MMEPRQIFGAKREKGVRLLVGTPLSSLSSVRAPTDSPLSCWRDRGPESPLSGSLESHDSRFLAMFARTETEGFSLLLRSSAIAPN